MFTFPTTLYAPSQDGYFDPTTISDCYVWLDGADAATIINSGGAVSQWTNKGSEGNAVQTTTVKKPTTGVNTINGRNVINWDGGDSLDIPSLNLSGLFTLIVVSKSSNDIWIEHGPDAAISNGFFMIGSGTPPIAYNRSGFIIPSNNSNWLGTAASFGFMRNDGTLFDYGTSTSTDGSVSSAAKSTASLSDTLYIGSRAGTANFMIGDIAELIVYNKALNSTELGQVHTGMTDKWGAL